ncbi:MAG: MoaD/ThiS family protein [Desulfobacterales bacterium]|nr:MoaD/ThiS family protein [Desulfobacterales bacterium]
MKVKVKFSGAFDAYKSDADNEFDVFCFDSPVTAGDVIKKTKIPGSLPKLILINGMVRNKDHVLQEGDTLSIFPAMAGG